MKNNISSRKEGAAKAAITIEGLRKKYNLGKMEHSHGYFYSGNNSSSMHNWAAKFGDHQPFKHYAAFFKKTMKEEFGLAFHASGKWIGSGTGDLTAYLETSSKDLFKPWEELSDDERRELRDHVYGFAYECFARNIGLEGYVTDKMDKAAKIYYEEIYTKRDAQTEKGTAIGMKADYALAFLFAAELLDSWNDDHTGKNPGDCDYVDRTFYEMVGYKLNDGETNESNDSANNKIEDMLRSMANQEEPKKINL